MADQRGAVAVFDLDETLIRCKSMFSFLEFAYVAQLGADAGYSTHLRELAGLEAARRAHSREEVNRRFWRLFAGWRIDELAALAEDWFTARQAQGDLFIPEVLAQFRAHQAQGDQTVLLSGSARFIIAPVARRLAADVVLAIGLEERADGTTSGEIEGVQTIGQGKAEALVASLAAGQPGRAVIGYGDHESDLPFLRLCDPAFCVVPAGTPLPDWAQNLHRLDITPADAPLSQVPLCP